MPPLEDSDRHQTALWWKRTGKDNYGRPILAPYVVLKVRWENLQDQALSKESQPLRIDATVELGQRIYPGDLMWLGEVEDWVGTGSNDTQNAIMEVDSYNEIPDLKERESVKVAKLVLFKGTLPGQLT